MVTCRFILVGESLKGIVDKISAETLGRATSTTPNSIQLFRTLASFSRPQNITAEAVLQSKIQKACSGTAD